MSNRWFGWNPDRPDIRDLPYKLIAPKKKLPTSVDLRQYCSPVENQGALGSCTAQALIGNLEMLQMKSNAPLIDVSRLFVYFNERVVEGTVKEDSGATIRTGIKVLARHGACEEKEWPYDIKQFAKKPPLNCYRHAKKHLITSYHSIKTVREILTCLAEGYPVVFGFTVYSGFSSEEVSKTGIAQLPKENEVPEGGHAVMAVGYNTKDGRILVRNSWGKSWGQGGYFTMPFRYIETLAADFWTIRR